ncbi:hypothetical protein [Mycolicibacterium sp.]
MTRDTAIVLSCIILAATIWLAFVNWHAAVIVLLLLILGNLGSKR